MLMALAHLAVERPGWAPACLDPIAAKMDDEGCPMYEEFKKLYQRDRMEACLVESHKLLRRYAERLNTHDGAKRDIPEKLEDWITRVSECEPVDL